MKKNKNESDSSRRSLYSAQDSRLAMSSDTLFLELHRDRTAENDENDSPDQPTPLMTSSVLPRGRSNSVSNMTEHSTDDRRSSPTAIESSGITDVSVWGGFLNVKIKGGKYKKMFVVVTDEEIKFCKSIDTKTDPKFSIWLVLARISKSENPKHFAFSIAAPTLSVTLMSLEGDENSKSLFEYFVTIQSEILEKYSKRKDYERIMKLLQVDGNNNCADCGVSSPEWIALPQCAFLCIVCSGVHRMFGTSWSRVASIKLGAITEENWEILSNKGNKKLNELYEANLTDKKPNSKSSRAERELFIYNKYIKHKYVDPLRVSELPSLSEVDLTAFNATTECAELRIPNELKEKERKEKDSYHSPIQRQLSKHSRDGSVSFQAVQISPKLSPTMLRNDLLTLFREDAEFRREVTEILFPERITRNHRHSSKKHLFNPSEKEREEEGRKHSKIEEEKTDKIEKQVKEKQEKLEKQEKEREKEREREKDKDKEKEKEEKLRK